MNKVIAYYYKRLLIKVKIQDVFDFLKKKKIKDFNKEIFWLNNIFYVTNYKIWKSSSLYILINNLTKRKTQGQKKVMTIN